jgi:solute carrier family 13 (sodium-dependent dicarboxylate transporter), member 2/3/5
VHSRTLRLAAGPLLGGLALLLAGGIPDAERRVLAVALWMMAWWLTEAVPLAATSLLPLLLFPVLGTATLPVIAAAYANELIFLFLAGFLLAAALQAWRAHERLALALVSRAGSDSRRIILGVMLATGLLSMWISNTATAAMMYPIAMAIGGLFGWSAEGANARSALMLGVAYAASIGGMGTLIGTPPNLILAASAERLAGHSLGFGEFMEFGVPMVAVLLPLCWALLVFVVMPGNVTLGPEGRLLLRDRRAALGRLAGGEARVIAVFGATALAWVFREGKDFGAVRVPGLTDLLPGLTDTGIGIAGALLLFALHARGEDGETRPLLRWREAREIPWEVLLLFGGGLALAAAMESSGLTTHLAAQLGLLKGAPPLVIELGLAVTVLLLSELASNTAVAAMAMPLAATLAAATGQPPLTLLLVTGFAASTGFALPIATPPNAIVFGSGQVTVGQMFRAGFLLDIASVLAIVGLLHLLMPVILGP